MHNPIIVNLPGNGIRLRFDGPDQRLRLIELIDFQHSNFVYKSTDLVRKSTSTSAATDPVGPSFRHLYYRLFGPSYPGEYIPPAGHQTSGIYVISWPGLAAKFSVRHQSWSEKADFVSQLELHASPALSVAIFAGPSWPDVRSNLYTKRPQQPRSLYSTSKSRDAIPDEIEDVLIHENGRIEMIRRSLPPFMLTLDESTSQDLIMELGPPDAIFKKPSGGLSIHATQETMNPHDRSTSSSPSERLFEHEQQNSRGSRDAHGDSLVNPDSDELNGEDHAVFYNYFEHGFDIMMTAIRDTEGLVATKLFLHGNIPGSHLFNRHRRSRWRIMLDDNGLPLPLTSEMKFQEISAILEDMWPDQQSGSSGSREQQGMVLNRGWNADASPDSSIELLGGFEEQSDDMPAERGVASNTILFGYPGFLFEVLQDDYISCLTVYHDPQSRNR